MAQGPPGARKGAERARGGRWFSGRWVDGLGGGWHAKLDVYAGNLDVGILGLG